MCLAVPTKIVSIEDNLATVDMLGNSRIADVSLLEDVHVGDYILMHAGFAIRKLDMEEAGEILEIFRNMESA